jgi:hypothetical protein
MKRIRRALPVILCLVLLCSVPGGATALAADIAAEAVPSANAMVLNGSPVTVAAYAINGNNYFKLRDLAELLTGTAKQFSVGFDGASNSIALTKGAPYAPVGGELTPADGDGPVTAALSASKVLIDGKEASLTAYTISGFNYFKLRDIGAAIDFGVTFDPDAKAVKMDTSTVYDDTGGGPALSPVVGTWKTEYNKTTFCVTLGTDGMVSENVRVDGTYTTDHGAAEFILNGANTTVAANYSIAETSGQRLLTVNTDLKNMSFTFVKLHGGGTTELAGTWAGYSDATGFSFVVTFTDSGTLSVTMKSLCGTYTTDGSVMNIKGFLYDNTGFRNATMSVPYTISKGSDGKTIATSQYSGRTVTFFKQ